MTVDLEELGRLLVKREEERQKLREPDADVVDIVYKIRAINADLARAVPALIEVARTAETVRDRAIMPPEFRELLSVALSTLSSPKPSQKEG